MINAGQVFTKVYLNYYCSLQLKYLKLRNVKILQLVWVCLLYVCLRDEEKEKIDIYIWSLSGVVFYYTFLIIKHVFTNPELKIFSAENHDFFFCNTHHRLINVNGTVLKIKRKENKRWSRFPSQLLNYYKYFICTLC